MYFVHVVARGVARGVAHATEYFFGQRNRYQNLWHRKPLHILINSAGTPPQKKVTFLTRGKIQNLVNTKRRKIRSS